MLGGRKELRETPEGRTLWLELEELYTGAVGRLWEIIVTGEQDGEEQTQKMVQ